MSKRNTDRRQPENVPGTGRTHEKTSAKENYPVEDRVLKDAAWFLGKELLPLLGVREKMRRAAPTEAVYLEISDFLADFNYEMEDSRWRHLEFESDSVSEEDLRRFHAYEAVVSYRHKVRVSTYVLCTSKAKVPKNHLSQGLYTYRMRVIRLKDYNADKIIRRVEKKQRKRGLRRRELLELLLTPLMEGETPQAERIRKGFEILQRERGNLDNGELIHMQSVLYALMTKFLTPEEIKEIKEMMFMTLMGQLLMEDGIEKGMKAGLEQGREQGREQGEFKTLRELVADGVLTAAEAAARKKMTEAEFQKKLGELGIVK